MTLICSVCGGTSFRFKPVLWDELVDAWELSDDERAYVDRQQGECCMDCGSNLRSIALAEAMRQELGMEHWLAPGLAHRRFRKTRVLELNEAGMLSPILARMPGRVFGHYPEVDMQAMPYPSDTFDLVVHSDTLEHVPDPIEALKECRRVLKPGGACCFTVPIIVGRLSRRRDGMPASFHGESATDADDWRVQTEWRGCLVSGTGGRIRIRQAQFRSPIRRQWRSW